MNSENLLVEAWQKAGIASSAELDCPDSAVLTDLLARRLSEPEARRLTLHMGGCAPCRMELARLVSSRSVPTAAPARLADLVSQGGISDEWRSWIRGVVNTLPLEAEELEAQRYEGFDELSPTRIDAAGRLIVDLALKDDATAGTAVRLSLESDGALLELCDVTVRDRKLYAAVDLSAFQPRPGLVRAGSLSLAPVPTAVHTPAVLPILADLQDSGARGAELWDRLAPAMAYGERLAAQLSHEIALADGDAMTVAPRRQTGRGGATADRSPAGRVEYALSGIENYRAVWLECNGRELEGAALVAAQLAAALRPVGAPMEVAALAEPATAAAEVPATVQRGSA